MQLAEFISWLRCSRQREQDFLLELRTKSLLRLFQKYHFVRGADAEDAVSETLVALLAGKVSGFSCDEPIDSAAFRLVLINYLSRHVAPRKLVDVLRRGKSKHLLDGVDLDSEVVQFEFGLWTEDPLERTQNSARLKNCVNGLSDKLRPVAQGVMDGEEQKDIARRLGIASVGTVKSRLSEAMKRLRDCLDVPRMLREKNANV
jgi:RNA polymerase sigma factor (sigma-70 family)